MTYKTATRVGNMMKNLILAMGNLHKVELDIPLADHEATKLYREAVEAVRAIRDHLRRVTEVPAL